MNEKKAWTVLIYANGNNDLDENIYREFLAVIDAGLPEKYKCSHTNCESSGKSFL